MQPTLDEPTMSAPPSDAILTQILSQLESLQLSQQALQAKVVFSYPFI